MYFVGEVNGALRNIHSGIEGRLECAGHIACAATPAASHFKDVLATQVSLRRQVMVHLHGVLLDLRIIRQGDGRLIIVGDVPVIHELPVFGRDPFGQYLVRYLGIEAFKPGKALQRANYKSYHRKENAKGRTYSQISLQDSSPLESVHTYFNGRTKIS